MEFIALHFIYAAIIVRNGWVQLPVDQTVIHIATLNQLKLQKTVAR